jgi:fructosamine-3-kinase
VDKFLKDIIAAVAGTAVTDITPLSGGTFGALYRVELADGSRLVAKTATGAEDGTLETEGWMLRYLADHSDLPVPEVQHAEARLLLMDWLPADGRLDDSAQAHAADLIAALHAVRGPAFGLERDTVIGPLPQPNAECPTWSDFLRDRRLLPMGREAHAAGGLSADALARLERFCDRIGDFVPEPEYPALLHGDLWTGNVLATVSAAGGRISGFIDPAIYYGDPEMDLAFSTLFATFGEAFFARYTEHRPLAPGFFETRRDICNLWPLLVHARLFGGSYGAQADAILRRFF